jgi:hypothetical protein
MKVSKLKETAKVLTLRHFHCLVEVGARVIVSTIREVLVQRLPLSVEVDQIPSKPLLVIANRIQLLGQVGA